MWSFKSGGESSPLDASHKPLLRDDFLAANRRHTMRIAILHYTKPPVIGGVERVIGEQAAALRALGHEVKIWSADESSERKLGEAASRRHSMVIVHNVFTMPFDLAWTRELRELAANSPGIRWINWVHDVAAASERYAHLPWDQPDYQMLRQAPPNCIHVAVSEIRRDEFCRATGLAKSECLVIPNGVDVAKTLDLSGRIDALAGKLRLWQRDIVLVHPARLLRRKNIELGIRMTAALTRKHSLDAAYLITGAPDPHNADSAACKAELDALIEELGIADSVFFLSEDGPLGDDDVRSLYAVGDALVFPSKTEGFGLPIVEAALHGLPVFCSDIPPHREIGGSFASFFSLDSDPGQIAEQIIASPVASYRRARRREAAGRFDWRKIAVDYLEPLLNGAPIPTA